MAFATADDVETRRGSALSADQTALAEQVIETVTGLIADVAGYGPAWASSLDPVPAYYKALCVEKAVDVLARPESAIASETLGAHSVTYARESDGAGIFLSEREELNIRRLSGSVSGSVHVQALPADTSVLELGVGYDDV